MIEKTRSLTRGIASELLDLNKQILDLGVDMNRRTEKQVVANFDASRATVDAFSRLQRSTVDAWLDLVAPVAVEA